MLRDLEGAEATLAVERPNGALLVFWNPDCGFCRSLRDDLLAWEAARAEDAPELLVLSSADAEALAAEGFQGRVLLDAGGEAMAAFRASGTPMAVRLDAEGRVASYLAAGGPEVLALAGAAPRLELHRRQPALP